MKADYNRQMRFDYIDGLDQFVSSELGSRGIILYDKYYCNYIDEFESLSDLRSVNEVHLEYSGKYLNPRYISKHKSIIFQLIEEVISRNESGVFNTFRLSVAGSATPEVKSIQTAISKNFDLTYLDGDADLKLAIGKYDKDWSISCRTTPRPLSLRDWNVCNIKGGLNPTVAYAMNTLTNPTHSQSFLNIFSGSGTLLIERLKLAEVKKAFGFDHNGEINSCAIQNIKSANMLKQIQIRKYDLFELEPGELGRFDAIVSDLPFGIQISKGEDIEELYRKTLIFAQNSLEENGILILYTSNTELLEKVLGSLNIHVSSSFALEIPTSIGTYLNTKIYVINT